MKPKIFLVFAVAILAIFLTSSVSAIVAYGDWADGSQTTQITLGNDIGFNADFFSMSDPMNVNIKLYDSQDNLVHSFENSLKVNGNSFSRTYSLTQSIYQNTGTYTLVLSGSDAFPDTDTYSLTLNVNPVPNNAPVITSTAVTSVDENQVYTYGVDATDADGDTLTYGLNQAPSWMSIDSSTGEITGTAPSVSADTDYSVTIFAYDGKDQTYQSFTITVNDIPAPTNNAPVITSNPVTEVNESENYLYQVTASDADGDALTYSINNQVIFSWLSIDSSTGEITGTAPSVSMDWLYVGLKVSVSDGTDITTQEFNITVKDTAIVIIPNNAPVITSNPVTEVNESENYLYQVTASDADGDALTYNLTQAPNWMTIDSNTGMINVTAPVVTNNTNYTVEISVSDGTNTSLQNYTLTVFNVPIPNNVPIITSTPGTLVDEDSVYNYQIVATDADGDTLTYSLSVAPGWLSINSTTGAISGNAPSVSGDIDYDVTIMVSDGKDVAIQTYILTVDNIPSGGGDDSGSGNGGRIITGGSGSGSGSGSQENEGPIVLGGNPVQKSKTSVLSLFLVILLIAIPLVVLLIVLYAMKR